jgi:hypothetical protein
MATLAVELELEHTGQASTTDLGERVCRHKGPQIQVGGVVVHTGGCGAMQQYGPVRHQRGEQRIPLREGWEKRAQALNPRPVRKSHPFTIRVAPPPETTG